MLKPESKESKRKAGRRNTPVVVKVQAVERMTLGANVTELARELGVDRSLLYYWKAKLSEGTLRGSEGGEEVPLEAHEREMRSLRAELAQAQSALGRAAAELDFFAAVLRRIEPSVPSRPASSASTSTSSSPSGRRRKAS